MYFSYFINQIKVTSEISPITKKVINIINALTLKFLISFFLSFEIESISKKPILVKISPDLNEDQLRDIALISLANNIDGLILTNSTTNRPDYLQSENKENFGGLSGKPLFKTSNNILKKMYNLTNGQICLIGVGGISSGSDCYEKIKSGASLTQLYTALVYSGPYLISKIKNELTDLIKTDGYKNISEVIGKSV